MRAPPAFPRLELLAPAVACQRDSVRGGVGPAGGPDPQGSFRITRWALGRAGPFRAGGLMKKLRVLLMGVALTVAGSVAPASAVTYAFHDEFSGTALNTATWAAQTGKTGGLCASAANARVSGGFLNMTVRRGTTTDCAWVGARLVS